MPLVNFNGTIIIDNILLVALYYQYTLIQENLLIKQIHIKNNNQLSYPMPSLDTFFFFPFKHSQ